MGCAPLSVGIDIEIRAWINGAIDVFARDAAQLGESRGAKCQARDQKIN
jgi:hypothetical protein